MRTIIIAEAGINHNGSMDLAYKLIDEAKSAGADYIKFQTFIAELNIAQKAQQAEYQQKNTSSKISQLDLIRQYELSFEQFMKLKLYCEKKEIGFLTTAFDIPSLDFAKTLKLDYYKIPSGEITNLPLLEHFSSEKHLILSTGMANIEEIQQAIKVLENENQITVLHCNTEYPTPMKDVNLKAMLHIKNTIGFDIGYSDHTKGFEVPIAAVTLGARMIEKHFTLDRNLPGPDHKASLEPQELCEMVKSIRNIELAIGGSGIKTPSQSEKKNIIIARKSIHITRDLKKGHVLTKHDLIMKRPGDGISPFLYYEIIGQKLICDLKADAKLELNHITNEDN